MASPQYASRKANPLQQLRRQAQCTLRQRKANPFAAQCNQKRNSDATPVAIPSHWDRQLYIRYQNQEPLPSRPCLGNGRAKARSKARTSLSLRAWPAIDCVAAVSTWKISRTRFLPLELSISPPKKEDQKERGRDTQTCYSYIYSYCSCASPLTQWTEVRAC